MRIVSSGKVLNSRAFYEKKKRRRRIKLILIAFALILIVSGLVYLVRMQRFLIQDVSVKDSSSVDTALIEKEVNGVLAGNYLWFIPRTNVFLYPKAEIRDALASVFPRFKSVKLAVDGQTLSVSTTERVPSALYCTGSNQSFQQCFFMDDGAFIFSIAPSFSDTTYFVYTTEQPIENPVGKTLLPINTFNTLNKFVSSLELLDMHPAALKVGTYEYTLTLDSGGKIIWANDADLGLVRSNLEAFLSSDAIKAQPDFLDKVESLDLRVSNKVFYKFKN